MTRKITRGLANIAQGLESTLYMGNLDALRDWGHTRDFVAMQWLMLQQDEPEDFVIATGYRSVMPINLYGPGDNFHPDNAHVIPALIRRFHEARERGGREVVIWGTGSPRREFMHVDDMASACVHLLSLKPGQYWQHVHSMQSHDNLGVGTDCSIRELAEILQEVTGFKGDLVFDETKPDGAPRKLLDVSRLERLGWRASISLRDGLESTYHWYCHNIESVRQ